MRNSDRPITNPFLNDTEVDFGEQEKCCLLLIAHGANPNKVTNCIYFDSYTPLHKALISGYDRIGKAMIEAGANVNAIGKNGKTPFHLTFQAKEHLMNGKMNRVCYLTLKL